MSRNLYIDANVNYIVLNNVSSNQSWKWVIGSSFTGLNESKSLINHLDLIGSRSNQPTCPYIFVSLTMTSVKFRCLYSYNFGEFMLYYISRELRVHYEECKLKVIKSRTKKFYLPKYIKILLLKKRKLWRAMKAENTPENKLNYNNNRHACKVALKKFHVNKMKAICNSKNIKHFYEYVNRKLGRSKSSIVLKDKNGTVLKDIISVEMFAKYFQSVFSVDDGILPNMNTNIKSCLNDIIFDEHDINTRLQALPIKYSCGPDEIPTAFLKTLHNVLALPLSLIFQNSLNSGNLPNVWKCANIVPVYKGNGTKFKVDNYRPISLTSTICKVMESVIVDHIYKYYTDNNLLTHTQHGFRKNKSTTSNLLEFTDDISKFVDNNDNVDVITVDFSKAFDKISHNKLLHKLNCYGISSKVLSWIKCFLIGRKFNVKLNNYCSKFYNITSSVPQGSKLGPLLYIIYANDIADVFNFANIKMFADDLTIYACINNEMDRVKLQNELNNFYDWCLKWGLVINLQKCKLMHFGYNNHKYQYNLGIEILNVSHCEKVLGVLIDDKLSFKDHVYMCVKKSSQVCNMILANVHNFENDILVNLYKTYARPYLDYNSVIYSPHYLELIDALENVQRHFTKRLHGLDKFSYVDRLNIVGLESVELRRMHNDLIILYKLLHKKIDCNVCNVFTFNNVLNTRGNAYKLVKNRCRLDCRKFGFTFRVINMWNFLSNDIVCSNTVKQFVYKLKRFDLSSFIRGRAFI